MPSLFLVPVCMIRRPKQHEQSTVHVQVDTEATRPDMCGEREMVQICRKKEGRRETADETQQLAVLVMLIKSGGLIDLDSASIVYIIIFYVCSSI